MTPISISLDRSRWDIFIDLLFRQCRLFLLEKNRGWSRNERVRCPRALWYCVWIVCCMCKREQKRSSVPRIFTKIKKPLGREIWLKRKKKGQRDKASKPTSAKFYWWIVFPRGCDTEALWNERLSFHLGQHHLEKFPVDAQHLCAHPHPTRTWVASIQCCCLDIGKAAVSDCRQKSSTLVFKICAGGHSLLSCWHSSTVLTQFFRHSTQTKGTLVRGWQTAIVRAIK